MKKFKEILNVQQKKLIKALQHLEYSYKIILDLTTNPLEMDERTLTEWESFAARFSRVTDVFLTRYLRTRVLLNDPGFTGSLRDFVNQAEKLQFIDDASQWMAIRELRNMAAHDYNEEDLENFFKSLLSHTPSVLKIKLLLADDHANH